MRIAAVVFAAAVVLMPAGPSDAARGTRKQCKQTCGPRIEQDCAAFKKRAKRACKRAILRACRRVALDACFLTPITVDTTTTTTTLGSSTTDAPITTSTTTTTHVVVPTTRPTTTTKTPTTTKPPTTTTTTLFHYAGDWTFFGDLVFDDCPGPDPDFFDPDVFVTHTPGSDEVGVAVEFYPGLFGTADRFGFDATNDFPEDDCDVSTTFVSEVTPNPNLMTAAFAIELDCPEISCTVLYAGDLER